MRPIVGKIGRFLASLTVSERIGLKSVLTDAPESLSRELSRLLLAIGLVAYDGRKWQLTENGRAIVHFVSVPAMGVRANRV